MNNISWEIRRIVGKKKIKKKKEHNTGKIDLQSAKKKERKKY